MMRMMDGNSWRISMEIMEETVLWLWLSRGGELLNASQNYRNSKIEMYRAPRVIWQVTGGLWVLLRKKEPVLCPLLSADLSVDSPLRFPGCDRCASILHPGCCVKLCVFLSFRIWPHKSASLIPLLWEQLFSAFPSIRSLASGNGSLRLENNRRPLGTKTKYSSLPYSQVVFLEAEPEDRLWGCILPRVSNHRQWRSDPLYWIWLSPFHHYGFLVIKSSLLAASVRVSATCWMAICTRLCYICDH